MGELFGETERFPEAVDAVNTAIALYDKYAEANPACAEKAAEAKTMLGILKDKQYISKGGYERLTPEEKEIASLLTDGLTRREIIRKLSLNAVDYEQYENAIRYKLSLMGELDPTVAAAVFEYKLTKRETDMLRCLRQNMKNDEMAAELFLSEETVRKHVRNLMKKLPAEKRDNIPEWR